MPGVVFLGEVLNGTAAGELITGVPGFAPNNTINAAGGHDLVLGDSDYFFLNYLAAGNNSLGTAMNIDSSSSWSASATNPLFDTPGPHTSIYIEPGAGQQRYFSVTVGAGETLTLDMDFAGMTGWGGNPDTVVYILDADGNVLASNDDAGDLDSGSFSAVDSRVSYTPAAGGTYYILVGEFDVGDGGVFEGNEQMLLNVSVTGHAATAAPIVAGNDIINGGDGNDTLVGMLGSDTVHGDAGNDIIVSTGAGSYFGDAGNDTIYANIGNSETLNGGADIDLLNTARFAGDYTIDLATGLTNYIGESFVNFENLTTGAGDDTLSGTAAANVIRGGDGDDVVNGLGGNDTLHGESGDDTLEGSGGNDSLYGGGGVDTINGGDDNDSIYIQGVVTGAAAHGDGGIDTLILELSSNDAVSVNLAGSTVQGANTMTTTGFENFLFSGAAVDVTVIGTAGVNTITTAFGDDVIHSQGGTDTIMTGAGNDTILGMSSGSLDGGSGTDTIDFSPFGSVNGIYYADLAAGFGIIGMSGPWFITLAGIENYIGLDTASDHVLGTGEANLIDGRSGDDVLSGLANDDVLYGGEGNDNLDGGADNDTLYAGAGDDTLNGGEGNDHLNASGGGLDTLDGGDGDDTIIITDIVNGAAAHGGGGDSDTLILGSLAAGAITVQLAGNTVQGANTMTTTGFENFLFTGSATDVTVIAGPGVTGTITTGDGNDTIQALHGTISSGAGDDTIKQFSTGSVDGGEGIDTIDYTPFGEVGGVYFADLAAGIGQTGFAGPYFATYAGLENYIGILGASDHVLGTGAANLINGMTGDDVLYGLAGNDTLIGDEGKDTLDGGANNDVLTGGAGDDVLNGGANADTMYGGDGNDWYYVDELNDLIEEIAGQGTDRVFASVNYTLAAGVQVEIMSTTNNAGTGALNLTGNELAQAIYGNAGANSLDGKGGGDTLVGFGGNDFYYVDNLLDKVVEGAGEGAADRVFASISWTLSAGAQVESLTTTNNAGTGAINLTGNELAQAIYGNAGDNVLDGKAGADTLVGFGGNDFFYIDNALDGIVEGANEGAADRAFASVSYTLGASAHVEMLTTDNDAGTAAINLTGNALVNTIWGNAGANSLDGKAGADTLSGFLGDDFYYVDNAADQVVEAAGQGTDRVFTSVSYTLAAGVSVETFTTTNNTGTGALNLTGNELANTIYGNDGANILDGKGGSDILVGRAGGDLFDFTTALGATNVDRISDFNSAADTIRLDDAIFTQIGAVGALNANAFRTGAAAQDADDRIVYNQATGQLFYDADGNGAGAAVLFANLTGAPALIAADFVVI